MTHTALLFTVLTAVLLLLAIVFVLMGLDPAAEELAARHSAR